jgi:hypothetical protein
MEILLEEFHPFSRIELAMAMLAQSNTWNLL